MHCDSCEKRSFRLTSIATIALGGISAGGCSTNGHSCAKRRLGLQHLPKRLLGRTSEQGQRRSSPGKSVLREEVAERRGTSIKATYLQYI